jgi:hypothetical protein
MNELGRFPERKQEIADRRGDRVKPGMTINRDISFQYSIIRPYSEGVFPPDAIGAKTSPVEREYFSRICLFSE